MNKNNLLNNTSTEILSQIVIFQKYAKFIPELKRRETWDEICDRNMAMHITKYPKLETEIRDIYTRFVRTKKVLPSMRSMQFGGRPIELANNRIYNCAYTSASEIEIFAESMFLLLGGTGLGYSVQKHHVAQLPVVQGPTSRSRRFLVGDSIEGWADAVKVLCEAHFQGKSDPIFDYRDIRQKGALLVTSGGKAPGPEPLRICIEQLRSILSSAKGRQLEPIEVHDMICHIADAVLSGGIRRAALIALFSHDDLDMLSCKSGSWWETNPQRGRANNSVVLLRQTTTWKTFHDIWLQTERSNAGEPGIFWTNNLELGTNPCAEISLNDMQFCNLCEINVSSVKSQLELNELSRAAAFLGTLQAGYTDFHYLRPGWKEITEKEALIGVGMTGIGSGAILAMDLALAAKEVINENARVAALIGINIAARCTTIKPSGTSSLTLGCASGIHAWHNDYYIRRIRVGKNEALYRYMIQNFPELVEDCAFKPHLEAVVSFPQKAPEGSIFRTESPIDTLNRVVRFNKEWVQSGHRYGDNYHNVSCTISLRDNDWGEVGNFMWHNRDDYTGISVLPYDGGSYVQAPFEDISEVQYDLMVKSLHSIDLTQVTEDQDETDLSGEQACVGGLCLI
jgi:ribonucleoside-triphosphate reductase